MALTDEQYQQLFKYVDEEMTIDEMKVFEAALRENRELYDELEFYKQIRLLGDAVQQKTSAEEPLPGEEKRSSHEEARTMLAIARKNWENTYEGELKLKYGITEATDTSTNRPKSRMRRINISRWLIAALLLGLTFMGIFWWYYQDEEGNPSGSINKTTGDSAVVTYNKATDSVANNIQNQPTLPANASSKNTVGRKDAQKQSDLFANNFKPDVLPAEKEGPLEAAFVNYEQGQYEQAIRDFENADLGPVTRGGEDEDRKLWTFYIHYYQALSYLAANIKTATAISELKKAITTSPDTSWMTKAQWYLALAHLKNNELKAAQALMKEVASNNRETGLKRQAMALEKALTEK